MDRPKELMSKPVKHNSIFFVDLTNLNRNTKFWVPLWLEEHIEWICTTTVLRDLHVSPCLFVLLVFFFFINIMLVGWFESKTYLSFQLLCLPSNHQLPYNNWTCSRLSGMYKVKYNKTSLYSGKYGIDIFWCLNKQIW